MSLLFVLIDNEGGIVTSPAPQVAFGDSVR